MSVKNGMSLIELCVVMIIIGTVAAVTLPNIFNSMEQSKAQAAENNLMAIGAAQEKYNEDHGSYCISTGPGSCGADMSTLSANLSLHLSTNDSFSYSCSAAVAPNLYTCVATDGTDTLTLSATVTGTTVSCAPAGGSCP